MSLASSRFVTAAFSSSVAFSSIWSSGTRPASSPRTLSTESSDERSPISRCAKSSRSAGEAEAISSRLPGA